MAAVLGLALGVAAGVIVLVLPIRTLESVTGLTGLARLMVQAEPPISPTDRGVLAVLAGTVTAGVGWLLVDWLLFGRAAMRTLFRAREDEFENGDGEDFQAADPLDLMVSPSMPHGDPVAQPGLDPGPLLQPGVPPPLVPAPATMRGEPVPEIAETQLSGDLPSFNMSGFKPEPPLPEPAPSIIEPEPTTQPELPPTPQPCAAPSDVGTPMAQPPDAAVPVATGPGGDLAKLKDLLARFERGVQSRRAAAARGLPAPSPPAGSVIPQTGVASPDALRAVPRAPEPVSAAPTRRVESSSDDLLDQPLHVTLELLRNMVKR